jgi:RNA polymerase sigma-70 factor, ECF subfamily
MGGVATGGRVPEAQFEALYREHSERLVRFCRLLLEDPLEAQDVVQDVFVRVMRTPPTRDGAIAWKPWLTRVALNLCRDRRRSWWWAWARRGWSDPSEITLAAPEPTPERATLGAELGDRIWDALQGLPRRQREVFALRHFEGWAVDDVAGALGISPGSVKQHLFRAVHSLRSVLGEYR